MSKLEELQAPFKPDEIEWRVGSTNQDKTKGLALAYVTNRAIQNRLDELFGCFGWQNTFKEWKNTSQLCGISVWDEGKSEWITKWDGADDSQTEAVKGGLSDSMKRAAVEWGIGRYLYKLESIWVDIEPCGKSYRIKKEPTLPGWALPEGYKPEPPKKQLDNNQSPSEESKYICADCQNEITATTKSTKEEIIAKSQKYHQKNLCAKCLGVRYRASQQAS